MQSLSQYPRNGSFNVALALEAYLLHTYFVKTRPHQAALQLKEMWCLSFPVSQYCSDGPPLVKTQSCNKYEKIIEYSRKSLFPTDLFVDGIVNAGQFRICYNGLK